MTREAPDAGPLRRWVSSSGLLLVVDGDVAHYLPVCADTLGRDRAGLSITRDHGQLRRGDFPVFLRHGLNRVGVHSGARHHVGIRVVANHLAVLAVIVRGELVMARGAVGQHLIDRHLRAAADRLDLGRGVFRAGPGRVSRLGEVEFPESDLWISLGGGGDDQAGEQSERREQRDLTSVCTFHTVSFATSFRRRSDCGRRNTRRRPERPKSEAWVSRTPQTLTAYYRSCSWD